MMRRILIIGGNGAGKTRLAKALAAKLGLPLIHLDRLYWRDNWQCATHAEFDGLLLEELAKPEWIIDGNNARTLPLRLKYCDTAIYLDFSRMSCLCGALTRLAASYGKSRDDMGGYCPERLDRAKLSFLKSVWNYNDVNRRRNYELLNSAGGVNVIILKNRAQASRFLAGRVV